MKRNIKISIRIKIIIALVGILCVTNGVILYLSIDKYQTDMIDSTNRFLASNMETLNIAIRNIMIAGEAPLAVNTVNQLIENGEFDDVSIYRSSGIQAFSDYSTLYFVNSRYKKKKFEKTMRLSKRKIDNPDFKRTVVKRIPFSIERKDEQIVEYYFPILNRPECQKCHGRDHMVRGVANFKVSVKGVYEGIARALVLFPLIFLGLTIFAGIVLIILLGRLIIQPLLTIGNVAVLVGEGNLDVTLPIRRNDEIGDLSDEMNRMIRGLKERFMLSRYVSQSTEDKIKGDESGSMEGVKKLVIVLFSDIRGFTTFAESNDPQRVISVLNKILSVQARAVQNNQGDIDNFIGDAIMSTFDDEYCAVRSAYEMIQAVKNLSEEEGGNLRVGIGIATGDAILGDIGSEDRRNHTVVGDTVNIAARLCAIAPPGRIYMSEATNQKLTGKIESEQLPEQKIKGKKEVINVFTVRKILKEKG